MRHRRMESMYRWHTNAETHVLRIGCLARTFTGFLAWLIHDSELRINSMDTPLSLLVLQFFFRGFLRGCYHEAVMVLRVVSKAIYHRCTLR
ncbi:hypothetical protein BDV38DRAFT_244996 [Aspergillus pseudotamarii]|uniref:Uncharacterized protein n=1 Tax=Aspergillus pseudotamarii TaxID=132259 RepID=A0A5N6SX08_ASPPS|nr:uncharacterized protein BDV38DRAFT_244996 [Aspergillus pseudotamarii]KAE8138270.1 hypothetical protein BDV38DRAFT_244996 [Aspergillus pseudotamarii]